MSCTPAPTCSAALREASQLWPKRSTASDGICASAAHHLQNPSSDHETGDAFDLTHDPANGCDCDRLAADIVRRRDSRVKYVIRNRRIAQAKKGWTWEPYTGANPHTSHMHVSILGAARNDTSSWFGGSAGSGLSDAAAAIIAAAGSAGVPGLGGIPGVTTSPDLSGIARLGAALTDGHTWVRILEVAAGALLVGAGLFVIVADTKLVKSTVQGVARTYTGGAVKLDGPGSPSNLPSTGNPNTPGMD